MIRYASPEDFQFVFTLIRMEAKNGHFILDPESVAPFGLDLKSVLASRTRLDGTHAYALIYEENGAPIGFVIVSFNSLNNIYELLLSAIWPRHRGKDKGKTMIAELLSQLNVDLMARCAPESVAMFHILTTNGFRHVGTGQKGVRALVRTL